MLDAGQGKSITIEAIGERPMAEQRFELRDTGSITASELRRLDRETQLEVMRHWFYSNFENPVEHCPYESAEGGYQYVYGGPYEPQEELEGKFAGTVPDELIAELTDELTDVSWLWSGTSNNYDPDDDLIRSIVESPKHLEAFQRSIVSVQRLLEVQIEPADWQCFQRLLYQNVVTALETYLSDNFISSVAGNPALLRKFVETCPYFKTQKVAVSDAYKTVEELQQTVGKYLFKLVWHRLGQVKAMFRDTLGVDFPADMDDLFKAVEVRHDLVHRNGRKEGGGEHLLNTDDILKLIKAASTFVGWIECQQSHYVVP
jgi:hypothetical protein